MPESEDTVTAEEVAEATLEDTAPLAESEGEPRLFEPVPAPASETPASETEDSAPAEAEESAVESAVPESAVESAVPESAVESAVPESADAALLEDAAGGLSWIPFAVYMGLWVVFVAVAAYFLYGVTGDQPARWAPVYRPLLWGGVGLTALGPVFSLAVWLIARARRPKEFRRGLFASAMTRGALVAFFGVVIWVGTLFVLELLAARGTL